MHSFLRETPKQASKNFYESRNTCFEGCYIPTKVLPRTVDTPVSYINITKAETKQRFGEVWQTM